MQGQNKDLTPYMLAAHLDVVPVIQDEWSREGFAASENEDGTMVYGRGAIDNKAPLIVSF